MKIPYLKYYLFLVLIFPLELQAQSPTEDYLSSEVSPPNFEEEKWKSITKGMEFDTEKRKERKPKEIKEKGSSFFMGEGWSLFAKFLLIMFFIIVIVFLIKNTLDNKNQTISRNNKTSSDEEILAEIEENIHDSDIDGFIKKALAEGNYALAIRLQYLNTLKALSTKKIIKWKKDKTNRAYLFEIKNTKLKSDFQKLTTIFERVWYGETSIEERDYMSIAPFFSLFSNEIKRS